MTKRFVVVGEAAADRATAKELADRVLIDAVSWLKSDPELLQTQRLWIEQLPKGGFLNWKDIPRVARSLGIVMRGRFDNDPGEPDAAAGRRAIAVILRELSDVDAIVLIRDADKQPERLQGLVQAREVFKNDVKQIVLGVAIPKRESWVIVGFEPKSDVEQVKLENVHRRISFDPRLRSHELTGRRDAKQVLSELTDDDWDRQQECWKETPLAILRQRGGENGLSDFLAEVEQRLVPLIEG